MSILNVIESFLTSTLTFHCFSSSSFTEFVSEYMSPSEESVMIVPCSESAILLPFLINIGLQNGLFCCIKNKFPLWLDMIVCDVKLFHTFCKFLH